MGDKAGVLNGDNVVEICKNGSLEDLANILKAYGESAWSDGSSCLNSIFEAANTDSDEERKARKISLISAYKADGSEALEIFKGRTVNKIQLQAIRQLAFNSSAEKLTDLLKAQGNDTSALQAILEGAKKDCDRRSFLGTTRARRNEKKDALFNFFAKSGPFAPTIQDKQAPMPDQEASVEKMQEDPVDNSPKKSTSEKASLILRSPK